VRQPGVQAGSSPDGDHHEIGPGHHNGAQGSTERHCEAGPDRHGHGPPAGRAARVCSWPDQCRGGRGAVLSDITDSNYAAAWALGGDNLSNGVSYASWVAGYSTTASITLNTYSQWGSSTVYASLTATQADGTVKTYSGTYTVSGGVIVAAHIVQTP
jgi:hypothetical protein